MSQACGHALRLDDAAREQARRRLLSIRGHVEGILRMLDDASIGTLTMIVRHAPSPPAIRAMAAERLSRSGASEADVLARLYKLLADQAEDETAEVGSAAIAAKSLTARSHT